MPTADVDLGYTETEGQAAFHRSTAPVRFLRGGYGGGKTWAVCNEAIKLAAINAGCVGGAVSATYPMLRDTMVRTLHEVMTEAGIAYDYHRTDRIFTLPWWGSEIHCRSADRPESLKGPNWGWAIGDEIALWDPEAWHVVLSRVRDKRARMRSIALAGTPEGFNWVYRVFVQEERDGYESFVTRTADNPGLPPEFVEGLRADYDPQHQAAYLDGDFVDLFAGRVYVAFERGRNAIPVPYEPQGPLCSVWDFNVNPACTLIGWREAGGRFVVYDEIRIAGGTDTEVVCAEFIERYGKFRGSVIVYADATGAAGSSNSARSNHRIIADAYRQHFGRRFLGVDVPKANPPVADRVNAVNRALRRGTLVVNVNRCSHTIDDFVRTSWRDGTHIIDKVRDREITHLSDALGYWVHREAPVRAPQTAARLDLNGATRSRFAGFKA